MIKTAPRISKITADFIPEYFRTLNAGCEYILNSWPGLFRRTLAELKGRFRSSELSIMIDVMNATMISPENHGRHLIMNCHDGIDLDGLDGKWGVEKKEFFKKLDQLTVFEATSLEIWANGFWYGGPGGENRDLDQYISKLSKSKK